MSDQTNVEADSTIVQDALALLPSIAPEAIYRNSAFQAHHRLVAELAAAREALGEVRDARQQATFCSGPCLFPQEHSGDESMTEFANRLQRIAREALSPEPTQEDDPRVTMECGTCGERWVQVLDQPTIEHHCPTCPTCGSTDHARWNEMRGYCPDPFHSELPPTEED